MDNTTRDEIARVLAACLGEPHPLRRAGAGLVGICWARPLLDSLTDEDVRTFFLPRLDRLLGHVKGCFACTAKAVVGAGWPGELLQYPLSRHRSHEVPSHADTTARQVNRPRRRSPSQGRREMSLTNSALER